MSPRICVSTWAKAVMPLEVKVVVGINHRGVSQEEARGSLVCRRMELCYVFIWLVIIWGCMLLSCIVKICVHLVR